MATIVLTTGGFNRTKTLAAGDVTRTINAMKIKFALPAGATNQQIWDATGDWLISLLKAEVLAIEREAAARTARDAVADVPLT